MADAWLSGFSTTLAIDIFAYDDFDTIRGGKEIVLYTAALRLNDTSRDALFNSTQGLPAAWTPTGSGQQEFTTRGTVLKSTAQPSSSSGVTSADSYEDFDVAMDFELLRPAATRQGGVVDVAVLEFDTGLGGTITVEVQRGPDDVLQARARATAYGRTVVGHNLFIDDRRFTLRIVRNGARVWAFYGIRDPRTRVYGELVKLLDYDQFAEEAGSIEARVSNLGARVDVQTRISNYTVESHVRIGPRLLDAKRIVFKRIVGNVPAATLEEVGAADIVAFGLFGEAVNPGGFEYTLPVPRTVGRERTRLLRLYEDEQVRDGED